MSLEPTLLKDYKKDREPPKWCVYYEDDTGDIVTVTNREKDFIQSPFIVTDSDDARKILMGHLDPKKFAVVDVNQQLKLVEKSAVLRIKEAEQRLSMVPYDTKTKADVNIVMYVNSWKMEVNFNQDTLYRMTGKRYFTSVSLNPEKDGQYDMIQLFLIKKNDPNFLIKALTIDPAELIEEGYLIFDMSPIRRICALSDISVLTKKIFASYRVTRKANFTGVDYRTRFSKRRTYNIPTQIQKDVSSDFTIIKEGDTYSLKSNFGNPQEQKIYNDIGIYLTDPKNPNYLRGFLTLPIKDVGWNKTVKLKTDIDLLSSGFLCRESSRDLTFDFIESATTETTNNEFNTSNRI